MDLKKLTDFFLCEGSVEGDVLKDVILLGPTSNNGREYSLEAMRSALPFYEGHAVHANHRLGVKMRDVQERFGHAENVRVVEADAAFGGRPCVRGDIPFLRSHPSAAQVVEAYQKRRPYYGVSHVADGMGRKENGKTYVEQITRISSLDLVDRAATGSLVEQDDAEAPAPMDPAAHAQEGMVKMVTSIVLGDGTPQEKADKIKALLEAMDSSGAAPPAPDAAPPMSEATLRKVMGELVEQTVTRALTTALPTLVEQERQRIAADAKYVKPFTPPPAPPPAEPKKDEPPRDSAARKKWLHSN